MGIKFVVVMVLPLPFYYFCIAIHDIILMRSDWLEYFA